MLHPNPSCPESRRGIAGGAEREHESFERRAFGHEPFKRRYFGRDPFERHTLGNLLTPAFPAQVAEGVLGALSADTSPLKDALSKDTRGSKPLAMDEVTHRPPKPVFEFGHESLKRRGFEGRC